VSLRSEHVQQCLLPSEWRMQQGELYAWSSSLRDNRRQCRLTSTLPPLLRSYYQANTNFRRCSTAHSGAALSAFCSC
jgi:hypothetical protein